MLDRFANLSKDRALSSGFRSQRFARYVAPSIDRIIRAKASCSVLDVGGNHSYWSELLGDKPVTVTLVNLNHEDTSGDPRFTSLVGDARDLPFESNSFDLVHSNSVIEHVGRWSDMRAMAGEIRRLAPSYFVQTPNFWFPIDPHSRAPFLHWLPINLRQHFHRRFTLGYYERARDMDSAMRSIEDAVMLDAMQMRELFPDAEVTREKLFGLTKSLMAVRIGAPAEPSDTVAARSGFGSE